MVPAGWQRKTRKSAVRSPRSVVVSMWLSLLDYSKSSFINSTVMVGYIFPSVYFALSFAYRTLILNPKPSIFTKTTSRCDSPSLPCSAYHSATSSTKKAEQPPVWGDHSAFGCFTLRSSDDYFISLIAACAAASLAIGTRNGEQDT